MNPDTNGGNGSGPDGAALKQRFYMAMGAFTLLGVLAAFTLDGKIRLATVIFLAGLALRTAIHYARTRGDSE